MTASDSSVVVAASATWHPFHLIALTALSRGPRLVAHCGLEAFSVLTRLPFPQRANPSLVVAFLEDHFPDAPLVLPPARMRTLVRDLHQRGIDGGSVYDGLVALTAAEHEAELLTLDRRAQETYRRCGIAYRLLA